jgi:hypothetical protein
MKEVTINGVRCLTSEVTVHHSEIVVQFNGESLQFFGASNEIRIDSNSCNLSIYGDHNSLKIRGNESNLHIYGDYLRIYVENNTCNLHIYGDYNDVVIKKGRAVIYGYYGNATVYESAKAEVHGAYKKINHLEEL